MTMTNKNSCSFNPFLSFLYVGVRKRAQAREPKQGEKGLPIIWRMSVDPTDYFLHVFVIIYELEYWRINKKNK